MIEIAEDGAFVRVDADGFASLVSEYSDAGSDATARLDVVEAFRTVHDLPLLRFELVTAGTDAVLVHQGWVDERLMGLRLALDEDRWQIMVDSSGFLAADLVRMAGFEPNLEFREEPVPCPVDDLPDLVTADPGIRRRALETLGIDVAWLLHCESVHLEWELTVVDSVDGPALYDQEAGAFEPTTYSDLFRTFTTLFEEMTVDDDA